MRQRSLIFVGLATALLFAAGGVRAQGRGNTALARSLFQQGVELADQEEWAEAADRFRRSLSIRDSAVVAFNLATALVHTGELVVASELLRRAARDDEAPDRLRSAARQELERLEPRLGQLTIEVEGPTQGLELRIGERTIPLAAIGVAVPADPGDHTLTASRGGEEVARADISISEGGEASASLSVPPLPEVPDPVETANASGGATGGPQVVVIRDGNGQAEEGGDDTLVWVVVIAAILVAGGAAAITTVLLLDNGQQADPIPGNLTPGTVEFGP